MIPVKRCLECGAAIPGDSPGGFCAQCLLGLGLSEGRRAESRGPSETAPGPKGSERITVSLTEKPGDRIGRYRLLQEIGQGGCGVVYMAEQEEAVRRKVALKVIKLGMDTKQVVARFEAERQALALMDHPNIARVLDAGATDTGRPYFVMELVGGIKITDYCDQNHLTTEQRLDLFMQVCRAIQHAHQKGIIHRDIKPSNVLVATQDGLPVPKVIDFGIAKATQGRLTEQTLFTAFEQFIGTPAYMSPEQAQLGAVDVDTRSDIYSLGVLLYELLTGKTPFDAKELLAAGLEAMRRTIQETEPPTPSTRLAQELSAPERKAKRRKTEIETLRGDLDLIVMKCLEKDRARRYETANGLAMDLRRHLNNEPVVASPPSRLYRLQKLVRRNRLTFTAAGAILAVILLGLLVSTREAIVATRARTAALAAEKQAQTARLSEAEGRRKAIAARDQAQEQELRARDRSYVANIALAYEALQKSHLGRARELQQKAADAATVSDPDGLGAGVKTRDLRGWEWRYLWAQTRGDDLFLLGRHDPMAQVASWMSDGVRAISSGKDGKVKLWNVDERRLLKELSFPDRVNGLALSPDGSGLVIGLGNGRISLLDTPRLQALWEVELPHGIGHLAYSPDGSMIAVAGDFKVSVVSTSDGSLRQSFSKADSGLFKTGLAFSPDSRSLAFSSPVFGVPGQFPELRVLDLREGTERHVGMPDGGNILTLAFSPDGRTLVAGDQRGAITIFDWPAMRVDRVLRSHHEQVICLAFSPDGTKLASAGADQCIKIWDTRTYAETCWLRGHDFEIWSIAFSPDGKRLISAAKDDTVRIWPTEVAARQPELRLPSGFGISHDGTNSTLVVFIGAGEFILGRLFTGEIILRGTLDDRLLRESSLGKLVFNDQFAFGFSDGHTELYDLRSGNRVWSVTNYSRAVTRLAGSGKGGRIAVAYEDGHIDVLRRETGAALQTLQTCSLPPLNGGVWTVLEFSRDGRRLLAGASGGKELAVWDLETGQEKHLQLKHREGLLNATISEDGEWVVTTSHDAFASLWEVNSGRELARFTGQFTGFFDAAISPDKTRVALTSNGIGGREYGHLSVWSPANEQQLVSFPTEEGFGRLIGWDPSSDNILTFAGLKLRLWHAPSWLELRAAEKGAPLSPVAWKVDEYEWVRKAAESGSALALNNLAWLLATCDNPKVRDGSNAVAYAERAVTLTGRTNALYLDTLAAAYAESGYFAEAVRVQKEALSVAQGVTLKQSCASRLRLYESNTPYRE